MAARVDTEREAFRALVFDETNTLSDTNRRAFGRSLAELSGEAPLRVPADRKLLWLTEPATQAEE